MPSAFREEAEANYQRGEACYTGRGALQDYAKAREFYEKAAALGHAEAEFRLGWLHDHGRGVPRDAATARAWYERAALKGSASAQYNLGVLYKKGRGVPPRRDEGARLVGASRNERPRRSAGESCSALPER